jgi:hypothetical protein
MAGAAAWAREVMSDDDAAGAGTVSLSFACAGNASAAAQTDTAKTALNRGLSMFVTVSFDFAAGRARGMRDLYTL